MPGGPRYSAGTRYDPSVLREMAARLEASATVTLIMWTVIGVVLGLAVGVIVGNATGDTAIGAIVGIVGGGVMGYLIGDHRALEARFTAQLALCQVAIEENTRSLPSTANAAEPPAVLSFDADATEDDKEVPVIDGPVAFVVPSGNWLLDPNAAVPGRYEGLAADDSTWWAKAAVGKTINLKRGESGVWVDIGQGARDLLDDRYRFATSEQHPAHVLVLDSDGEPILLLRHV